MIGARALLSGLVAVLGIVPVVAAGGPGPADDIAADRLVTARAAAADEALGALHAALAPGLETARRGAARTVSGSTPAGPALAEAAATLSAAEPAAARALSAVAALNASLSARDPSSATLDVGAGDQIGSIATQLEATAAAADAFAEMRRRASGIPSTLDRVLTALEEGDLERARTGIEHARLEHDALERWEVELVTLPVWLETTDAMIGAVETIVEATDRGDAGAAAEGAAAFAALEDDAATADRALRIAVSEGGSAVTAAPLGRLAIVLDGLEEQRAAVAAILHDTSVR